MSAQNDSSHVENTNGEDRSTTDADVELRALDERLAELRAKGIIGGGEGPRSSLRAIAHVPGALERFLKRRD